MSRNVNRTADRVAKIVLLVGSLRRRRICAFFPRPRVEEIVTQIFESTAVERTGARLGFHFHRAGSVAPILRAVVGGQDLKLRDRLRIGINVQRRVGPIVHVVAAVQFPVVVRCAAAVHAVLHVAVHPDLGIVLTGLAHDAGSQIDQLREIATVEYEVIDLFASDGACQIR